MGGFEFGNVQELNSTVTLVTFLAVIVFVVFFDMLIGLMEYFLSGSQLYNRMIQMIYKELMLMGLVSFTIIMVEAGQSSSESHNKTYEEWIAGIEFSHILIFYLTFFFVAHAFYLMRTSIVCSASYRRMFAQKLPDLVKELEDMSAREKYYFNSPYLPMSSLRDRVEFQLILKLFNETYFLCENFNFASYLSGCFDRYALKTIDRSTFTWFVLMILSILNYTRIKAGFGYHNCEEPATAAASAHHRYLSNTETPSIPHETVTNSTSTEMVSAVCPKKNVSVFIFAAILLCLYTFLMLIISRMYKLRLINRIGLSSPKDYEGFLKFAIQNEVTTEERISPEQLKKEIDNVMDADEYQSDESEYREIGEFLIRVFSNTFDTFTNAYLEMKVYILSIIDPDRVNKAGDSPALLSIRDNDAGHHDNSGGDLERNDDSGHSEESDNVGGMTSPPAKESEVNSKKKMVSQLSMKNRLSATSTAVKKMSMITPKSVLPPPINTNNESSNKARPKKDSITDMFAGLKGTEDRPPAATVSHIVPRSGSLAQSGRKVDNSILELLQSVQFKEADSDNKFISKPRLSIADLSNPSSSNNLNGDGQPSSAAPPSATRRRASIHIKHPGGLSTIEKFHMDHQKSVIAMETVPQRGRSTIDVNALAAAAQRAKMNKITPADTPNTTDKTANAEGEGQGSCWSTLKACCLNLMKKARVADEGQKTDDEGKLTNDFMDMFLFGKPILFFRAVEVCIMFNCLYLAFWITNFIKICAELHAAEGWKIIGQVLMAVPLIFVIPSIGSIAQTSSLLTAVSELNLEVVHAVLIETEDVNILLEELRTKMLERIATVETAENKKMDIIHGLFNEIDQDGSGSIDKTEFRLLLKALKLTYSDQRFKRLYRAVDADGDNNIGINEIDLLLNPKVKPVRAPPVAAIASNGSTPSGSGKLQHNEEPQFESPIRRRGSQPARAAERLRSLSSIDDYSDTDSDEEGVGGGKKNKKKQLQQEAIDSLNNSLTAGNNQPHDFADGKVLPYHEEDTEKPLPEDLV